MEGKWAECEILAGIEQLLIYLSDNIDAFVFKFFIWKILKTMTLMG